MPTASQPHSSPQLRRAWLGALIAVIAALALAACSSSGGSGTSGGSAASGSGGGTSGAAHIAFLSFAVQNAYDAAMLASIQATAKQNNASVTVFDGNSNSQTQYSQFQDAIASGKYDGILVQAVDGAALLPLVKTATAKKIKVVAVDQILGPDLTTNQIQAPGLSAQVVFVPYDQGVGLGQLTQQACAAKQLNTCKVGYLYSVKASPFDTAVRKGYDHAIAAKSGVQVVAEGQSMFTVNGGLSATQAMLTAHPDINVIVGSDQAVEGAAKAVQTAGKTGQVQFIATGGSTAGYAQVASGAWFGDVANIPATNGKVATQDIVDAIRTGKDSGASNPADQLPNHGLVTKANASQFTGQWAG